MEKIILQKFIASSGYCSRRKAEKLILEGEKVFVNGKLAEAGMAVGDEDEVIVDGVEVGNKQKKIYIKLNKPVGYTSTSAEFKGDKNIYELLPGEICQDKSLHIVGRLDKKSCGLMLVTNDGDLTQKLTHPSFEHEKKYLVKTRDKVERDVDGIVEVFTEGMELEEIGFVRAKGVEYLGDNRFEVTLAEGKKRQIRRMFAEVHEWIDKLERTSIASLKLGNLKVGKWEYLSDKEIKELKAL